MHEAADLVGSHKHIFDTALYSKDHSQRRVEVKKKEEVLTLTPALLSPHLKGLKNKKLSNQSLGHQLHRSIHLSIHPLSQHLHTDQTL